jgi:hypothetical protein|tara:strand:+ start:146 stop:427 length:282 start_codon:yes stop_codon:yes gene_type:complete
MAPAYTKTMKIYSYDDLLDRVSTSGLFEMTDCVLEIRCPLDSDADQIAKMVNLIESMVHLKDVQITSTAEDLLEDSYRVIITEATDPPKRFPK